MLKIFAKLNTDEKVAVLCARTQVLPTLKKLNSEYGGDWILVDELHPLKEILIFNDGQVYRGYESNQPDNFRYSKAIKTIRL
jgi:hypothetical protein